MVWGKGRCKEQGEDGVEQGKDDGEVRAVTAWGR